jgi:hypothetical protein
MFSSQQPYKAGTIIVCFTDEEMEAKKVKEPGTSDS